LFTTTPKQDYDWVVILLPRWKIGIRCPKLETNITAVKAAIKYTMETKRPESEDVLVRPQPLNLSTISANLAK